MDQHDAQQDYGGSEEWLKYHRPQKWPPWRKASREALKLDDAAIRDAFESFLRGKYDEKVKNRLRFLRDRLGPYLLQALADSRLWTTHYEQPREFGEDMTPFQTFVDLLFFCPPPEAADLLKPYIVHPDPHFRKFAAVGLGRFGTEACIEPLTLLLSDPDDNVRAFAIMGVQQGAFYARNAAPRFLEAMFERIAALLSSRANETPRARPAWLPPIRDASFPERELATGNFHTCYHGIECLIALDPEKAWAAFLNEPIFHKDNRHLHLIVEKLNDHKLDVPPHKAYALLDQLRPHVHHGFNDVTCGQLLLALARVRAPGARETILEARQWESDEVRQCAAQALGVLEGISNASEFVQERRLAVGFRGLSKPQKAYYCVWTLSDWLQCGGGFVEYFGSSIGSLAHLTCKALHMLGATQSEQILCRAMSIFPHEGPSRKRAVRLEQVAAVLVKKRAYLQDLDHAFRDDCGDLGVRLHDFARRYKSHFGAAEV